MIDYKALSNRLDKYAKENMSPKTLAWVAEWNRVTITKIAIIRLH